MLSAALSVVKGGAHLVLRAAAAVENSTTAEAHASDSTGDPAGERNSGDVAVTEGERGLASSLEDEEQAGQEDSQYVSRDAFLAKSRSTVERGRRQPIQARSGASVVFDQASSSEEMEHSRSSGLGENYSRRRSSCSSVASTTSTSDPPFSPSSTTTGGSSSSTLEDELLCREAVEVMAFGCSNDARNTSTNSRPSSASQEFIYKTLSKKSSSSQQESQWRSSTSSSSTAYSSPSTSTSSSDCAICLREFGEGEALTRTQCGHVYHALCLFEAWQRRPNCPLCRDLIDKTPLQASTSSGANSTTSASSQLQPGGAQPGPGALRRTARDGADTLDPRVVFGANPMEYFASSDSDALRRVSQAITRLSLVNSSVAQTETASSSSSSATGEDRGDTGGNGTPSGGSEPSQVVHQPEQGTTSSTTSVGDILNAVPIDPNVLARMRRENRRLHSQPAFSSMMRQRNASNAHNPHTGCIYADLYLAEMGIWSNLPESSQGGASSAAGPSRSPAAGTGSSASNSSTSVLVGSAPVRNAGTTSSSSQHVGNYNSAASVEVDSTSTATTTSSATSASPVPVGSPVRNREGRSTSSSNNSSNFTSLASPVNDGSGTTANTTTTDALQQAPAGTNAIETDAVADNGLTPPPSSTTSTTSSSVPPSSTATTRADTSPNTNTASSTVQLTAHQQSLLRSVCLYQLIDELFQYASVGHFEAVSMILASRLVDVKTARDVCGNTVLHFARSLEIVKLCVEEWNADVNATNDALWTPLHWASECENPALVYTLLQYGADPDYYTNCGRTARELATSEAVLSILDRHEAELRGDAC
ncbi:unnamed protein product [Amoebophrya sp. A25]|nr:unnamed protein product [Amoebophrya sp. A25]|eukprot:GSA25T00013227001.1